MATSGSVDLSTNRDDVIEFALEKAGIINIGATPTSAQYTSAARELNFMVKHWQVNGLQLWAKKRAYMFLADDTSEYQLGGASGADHATNSYVQTALSADAAASATTITVDSITGISASDNIGIVLDDGTLHWDTVNGAPSGSTVTLTTGLASAASDDAVVFAYTNNITKPLRLLSVFRRNSDKKDTYIDVVSTDEYSELSDKFTDGVVNQVAFNPERTYSTLYVWPQTDDVSDIIGFWYHRPFEDFDASSDEPDFPQEWFLTIGYALAAHLGLTYSIPGSKQSKLNQLAEYYKMEVEDWDQEDASVYFEPNRRK